MLQGLNEAFNKAKREEQENELILESVLNAEEEYLDPEDEDDLDAEIDVDSIPPEVMNKVDSALDKIIGDGIDDETIDEMLDDDSEENEINVVITEACKGPWYDDEKIGHPNKDIRDGVKDQPRFMSDEGLDLSCEMMEDLENM